MVVITWKQLKKVHLLVDQRVPRILRNFNEGLSDKTNINYFSDIGEYLVKNQEYA